MTWIFLLLVAAICGWGASAIASSKGNDTAIAFWIGFLLGPLGLLIVGFMAPATPSRTEHGTSPAAFQEKPSPGEERIKCPRCAELIMREAKVCRFCGFEIPQPEPLPPPPPPSKEERLGEAHRLLRMGHQQEAAAAYVAIVQEFPDYIDAWRCVATTSGIDDKIRMQAKEKVALLANAITA